jgi:hypothetical protein
MSLEKRCGHGFDPDRRASPTMAFELARIWPRISSVCDVKRKLFMGAPESIDWDAYIPQIMSPAPK